MRYIDAFNHFFPQRFFAGVLETPAAQKDMGKRIRGIPALWDLEKRLEIVELVPRLQPDPVARHAGDRPAVAGRQGAGMGAHRQ